MAAKRMAAVAVLSFLLGCVTVFYGLGPQRDMISLASGPIVGGGDYVRAPPRSLVSIEESTTSSHLVTLLNRTHVQQQQQQQQQRKRNGDVPPPLGEYPDLIVPMYKSGYGARTPEEAEYVWRVGSQVVKDTKTCVNEEYGSKIASSGHKFLFNEWMMLARKLGIRYMLTAGTLYGAVTVGAPLPWDLDFDLAVDIRDIPKLEAYAAQLPLEDYGEEDEEAVYGKGEALLSWQDQELRMLQSDERLRARRGREGKRMHIFLHPDWRKVSHERRRLTCWGETAETQIDHCSFMEPHGRILGSPINKYMHIDIFAFRVDEKAGKVTLLLDDYVDYNMDEILPLRTCELFGLPASCANQATNILRNKYGEKWLSLLEEYTCKEGVFRKNENFKRGK